MGAACRSAREPGGRIAAVLGSASTCRSEQVPGCRRSASSVDPMLRYLTAGESHGRALVVIIEGLPAGLPLAVEEVQAELARRRLGYGRGPRMRFEQDEVSIIGG